MKAQIAGILVVFAALAAFGFAIGSDFKHDRKEYLQMVVTK